MYNLPTQPAGVTAGYGCPTGTCMCTHVQVSMAGSILLLCCLAFNIHCYSSGGRAKLSHVHVAVAAARALASPILFCLLLAALAMLLLLQAISGVLKLKSYKVCEGCGLRWLPATAACNH